MQDVFPTLRNDFQWLWIARHHHCPLLFQKKKYVPVCSVLCEFHVLFHVIPISYSVQIPIPAFYNFSCDLRFILLRLLHNPSVPYYIYTPSVLPSLPHILTPSFNHFLIICLKSKPSSHLLFPSRCCCGMTPQRLHLTFHPCSSGCAGCDSRTLKLLSSFFPRKLIANTIISSQKQLTSAVWNIKTKKKNCTVLLKLDANFINHFRQ